MTPEVNEPMVPVDLERLPYGASQSQACRTAAWALVLRSGLLRMIERRVLWAQIIYFLAAVGAR